MCDRLTGQIVKQVGVLLVVDVIKIHEAADDEVLSRVSFNPPLPSPIASWVPVRSNCTQSSSDMG